PSERPQLSCQSHEMCVGQLMRILLLQFEDLGRFAQNVFATRPPRSGTRPCALEVARTQMTGMSITREATRIVVRGWRAHLLYALRVMCDAYRRRLGPRTRTLPTAGRSSN